MCGNVFCASCDGLFLLLTRFTSVCVWRGCVSRIDANVFALEANCASYMVSSAVVLYYLILFSCFFELSSKDVEECVRHGRQMYLRR